jgi:RNA polymerase sigma factor (sigma-70 family)
MSVGTQRLDFAEFYRRSKDECLCTVLVSVGDRDTAQELVDEAFARAWASWRTVSRHPAPVAWVVRTALNANISRWRRLRREVSVPDIGVVADSPAAEGVSDGPVDARIMAALLRLPARQRQVVALRLVLDLDTERTAEVLGISPSAVKSHLARAITSLRADLTPDRQWESSS